MRITVHTQDSTIYITAISGQTLAQAIWLSGKIPPPALCSALGKCGQCKVLFLSTPPEAQIVEQNILTIEELNQGIRLACRHKVDELVCDDGIEISLKSSTIKIQNISNVYAENSALLAVDLGTTSLHWQAISPDGTVMAGGEQINPQMGAGSDIVSRLAFALQPQGVEILSNLVVDALQNIMRNLPPVSEICLAANTAMSAILLKKDVKSLAVAPYELPLVGHNVELLEGLAPIYIPPQLAPFVGGDISAGYAALSNEELNYPFIFVDLGTNGEFILAHDAKRAHITSVPLGPALEGIGLSLGHMAHGAKGIVCHAHLSPKGLEPTTIDGALPTRICGTGYLSILHCLLRAGIIDETGHFSTQDVIKNPFTLKLRKLIEKRDDEVIFRLWPHIANAEHMYISSTDIEEILKVKAAFSLAMQELLQAAKMSHTELKAIYLAGAMGSHVQGEDLEALGFIPLGMSARLLRVGNTSLNGAKILLTDMSARDDLYAWSKHNMHIQLVENDDFINKYMQHMRFASL